MHRMHIIYKSVLERKVCHLLKDCSMQISIDEFCQVVWVAILGKECCILDGSVRFRDGEVE